jgi:hypothetical protein
VTEPEIEVERVDLNALIEFRGAQNRIEVNAVHLQLSATQPRFDIGT